MNSGQAGVFFETAHPAKFTETVEAVVGENNVPMPAKLAEFMKGESKNVSLDNDFQSFRNYLLTKV
jgi:threonine synthase